jgi:hypothetical protein
MVRRRQFNVTYVRCLSCFLINVLFNDAVKCPSPYSVGDWWVSEWVSEWVAMERWWKDFNSEKPNHWKKNMPSTSVSTTFHMNRPLIELGPRCVVSGDWPFEPCHSNYTPTRRRLKWSLYIILSSDWKFLQCFPVDIRAACSTVSVSLIFHHPDNSLWLMCWTLKAFVAFWNTQVFTISVCVPLPNLPCPRTSFRHCSLKVLVLLLSSLPDGPLRLPQPEKTNAWSVEFSYVIVIIIY